MAEDFWLAHILVLTPRLSSWLTSYRSSVIFHVSGLEATSRAYVQFLSWFPFSYCQQTCLLEWRMPQNIRKFSRCFRVFSKTCCSWLFLFQITAFFCFFRCFVVLFHRLVVWDSPSNWEQRVFFPNHLRNLWIQRCLSLQWFAACLKVRWSGYCC